jgi:hypothetical protein
VVNQTIVGIPELWKRTLRYGRRSNTVAYPARGDAGYRVSGKSLARGALSGARS